MRKRPSASGETPVSKRKSVRLRSIDLTAEDETDDMERMMAWFRVNSKDLIEDGCDTKTRKFVDYLLKTGFRSVSKRVLCEKSGLCIDQVNRLVILAAQCILVQDREHRKRIELTVITDSGQEKIQYIDNDMDDETPALTGRRDSPTDNRSSGTVGRTTELVSVENTHLIEFVNASFSKPKVISTLTNILQSRSRYSMLLRDNRTKQFRIIGGSTINPLQHTERTCAECLYECWRRRTGTSENTDAFGEKVRLKAQDNATSNTRNERFISYTLGKDWLTIILACEDHLIALALKGMSSLIEDDVTGQIHFALAMTDGSARMHCRSILKEIVQDWLVVRRGLPEPDGPIHMKRLLQICLRGAPSRKLSTQLKTMCIPNADPHVHGVIEVTIPNFVQLDRDVLVNAVTLSLDHLLLNQALVPVKRHRWRGLYNAFARAGLLLNMFGIGKELFRRLVERVRRIDKRKAITCARETAEVWEQSRDH